MKAGRRASLWFWQILATLGALLVCVLMLHFLVVLIARPAPLSYSLDAITSALGSGVAAGELDVQLGDPPSPSQQGKSARALGLALADRLGVELDAVRVVVDWQSSDASEQVRANDEVRYTASAMDEMPDQIVGGFTAALRLNDGKWRVVRSSSRGIESWQWQDLSWLVTSAVLGGAIALMAIQRSRRNRRGINKA